MTRAARTSLLAVAGLVGALLGTTPAHAVPPGAVPLFESEPTESPQLLEPLGRTDAGTVWTEGYGAGIWVQAAGEEPARDNSFTFPEVVGELITELSDDESGLTWRTVADPEVQAHEFPVGQRYETRTATGYVARRGSGPYQIVQVDLLAGTEKVLGTSTKAVGVLIPSSLGVAAMNSSGVWTYFSFATASSTYTGKVVPTPARYLECPWLSRSHLFCYSNTGVSRISLNTGAVNDAPVLPAAMIETSSGVAFVDESAASGATPAYTLKTWATTATAPTTRVDGKFGLTGTLASAGTTGAVLVGRDGPLGRAGIWSVPVPSGTASLAVAAPAEPRRAGWGIAISPGSVAWIDNSAPSGNLWTRNLDAAGMPGDETRLVTGGAVESPLSSSAGRLAYTSSEAVGPDSYAGAIQLVDGDTIKTMDEDEEGWTAVLSGDRLLTESMSFFDDESVWRLRNLRTGTVTTLPPAVDYDLWGERLVRLEYDGRVTVQDLRDSSAPAVELRAAEDVPWVFGSVFVAGDVVAWDIMDLEDFSGMAGDRAAVDVATGDPAVALPDGLVSIDDLSTGYVVGTSCTGPQDENCVTESIALADGQTTDLGVWWAVVDGNVVAGVDEDGMASVQPLPSYTDAPRLFGDPAASTLAGPGRTWKARVVTSRVLSECAVEIRDAEDAVVRSLECLDPFAAETVEWDGTDDLGEPVEAGEYTWQIIGATGAEHLVDYDGTVTALTGSLTVSAVPAPTANVTPADNSRSVAQTTNLTAQFSEDVGGVSGTTFLLRGPDGATVPASVTFDAAGMSATLNPSGTLTADTAYTATLVGDEAGIQGAEGGPLETRSWTFTTGPAPSLTKLTPASNGTSAAPSGNLTAVFSEPVTGLSTETFELSTADDDPVPGVVTYSSATRSATFDPTANLLPDTRYTATLTGGTEGVRDIAGNPLTTRSWSFTTGPAPTVTGTSPAADATRISRTANVVAAFSEQVTGVSGTTVKLRTSSGTTVSAAVSYSTTTRKVTLNPTKTLAANTKYTVTLTGGTTSIRDAVGNPLATKTWSFTTGS